MRGIGEPDPVDTGLGHAASLLRASAHARTPTVPARDETGSDSFPDTPRLHLDPGVSAGRGWNAGTKDGTLNPEELSVRYGVEFDMDSVPRIRAEHGLVHPLRG